VRLAQARALHACLDLDRSGELVLAEAVPLGVDGAGFLRADEDANGALSEDEFLVVLSRALCRRGLRVAPDLAAESLRIQARGRARRALAARGLLEAPSAPTAGRAMRLREVELEIRRQRLRLAILGGAHADARSLRAELDRLEARRMLLLRRPHCGDRPGPE
jgi:hypothetical protein